MKKLLALTMLLVSTQATAKALPPILDYLPSCTPVLIEGIYVENKLQGSATNKLIESSFYQIRQKAKEKRVDAIIITNLIETNKIIITADLVDFCDEDDSLSSISTAYNQLSRKPISFNRIADKPLSRVVVANQPASTFENEQVAQAPAPVTIQTSEPAPVIQTPQASQLVDNSSPTVPDASMSELQLAKLSGQASFPSPNVTLSSAYGVRINDSTDQLIKTLGPASATFTLNDQSTAWLYGRELWFIITNSTIQKITYKERSMLNFTGKNLISYNEKFDNNWIIDDKASYREDVYNVKQKLSYLQQKTKQEYIVSNQNNLLTLEFKEFSSYYDDQPELLLSGFTFQSRNFNQNKASIIYSDIRIDKLAEFLLPAENGPPKKLTDLVTRYVPNEINFSDSGQWNILTKNIQVKHENSVVKQIKLSESINYPIETDTQFMNYLSTLNIPTTRQAMMNHFSDQASSWLETINVVTDSYSLTAQFASEDDDAMLISLEVEYL